MENAFLLWLDWRWSHKNKRNKNSWKYKYNQDRIFKIKLKLYRSISYCSIRSYSNLFCKTDKHLTTTQYEYINFSQIFCKLKFQEDLLSKLLQIYIFQKYSVKYTYMLNICVSIGIKECLNLHLNSL